MPYIGEVGRAAYGALCVVIIAVAAIEFLMPGLIANFVAPQTLVGLAFIAGVFALASPRETTHSLARKLFYGVLGLLTSMIAYLAAWYYFASVPAAQAPLAYAFGGVGALMFIAYGLPILQDRRG